MPLSPRIVAALAALPKRGLWVLSSDDGSFLVYRTMLKAIRRLYKRAGVVVPRSETGHDAVPQACGTLSAPSALAGASRS